MTRIDLRIPNFRYQKYMSIIYRTFFLILFHCILWVWKSSLSSSDEFVTENFSSENIEPSSTWSMVTRDQRPCLLRIPFRHLISVLLLQIYNYNLFTYRLIGWFIDEWIFNLILPEDNPCRCKDHLSDCQNLQRRGDCSHASTIWNCPASCQICSPWLLVNFTFK